MGNVSRALKAPWREHSKYCGLSPSTSPLLALKVSTCRSSLSGLERKMVLSKPHALPPQGLCTCWSLCLSFSSHQLTVSYVSDLEPKITSSGKLRSPSRRLSLSLVSGRVCNFTPVQVSIECHFLQEAFLSTPSKFRALLVCSQGPLHLAVPISSLKSSHFICEGGMKCHLIMETADQDRFPCCMFP